MEAKLRSLRFRTHGKELQRNASHEGSLAANSVNQIECAQKRGYEFDNSEDCSLGAAVSV